MNHRRDIHERVLQAVDHDELAEAYADWAHSYDADLVDQMGYRAPFLAAGCLAEHLEDMDARLLDAGCGTGLVGAELQRLGFRSITGVDYSEEMLTQAAGKSAYTQLARCDLTEVTGFEAQAFDAVICVGTLTLGHVGPTALNEFVRITQPGGLVCFTVRDEAWAQDDYPAVIEPLAQAGRIEVLVHQTVPYIEEDDSSCHLGLFRVGGLPIAGCDLASRLSPQLVFSGCQLKAPKARLMAQLRAKRRHWP